MWQDLLRKIFLVTSLVTVKMNWASSTILGYHSCLSLLPVLCWWSHYSSNALTIFLFIEFLTRNSAIFQHILFFLSRSFSHTAQQVGFKVISYRFYIQSDQYWSFIKVQKMAVVIARTGFSLTV